MSFMKIVPSIFLLVLALDCAGQSTVNDSTETKTAPWFVEKFKVTTGFFVPVSNTNIQMNVKGSVAR